MTSRYYENLLVVKDAATGLWPGVHDSKCPLWKDGRNVLFTAEGVRKMKGWSSLNSGSGTANPIRGATQQQISGIQYLFYGTPTALYRWRASDSTGSDVSKAGGYSGNTNDTATQVASTWSFANWGTYIIATNGQDSPQSYQIGTSTLFSDFAVDSEFTTAEIFLKHSAYLLAFNTDQGSNWVHWCDTDDITTWAPTASNAAGNLIIRDLESEIRAAVPIGDRIAVYGKDSMHIISFIGAPNYFGWTPAVNGIGAVGKRAVVSVGRKNYGLSRHGFWVTDGVEFQWIDEPAIRTWHQDRMNWSQASKVCSFHDEENTQVVWYYPTDTGEPEEGVGYNYIKGVWTIFSHGRTTAIERQVFGYPITATSSGDLFYENFGDDADGSAMTAYLESKAVDGGMVQRKNLLEARVRADQLTGTLNLKVATKTDRDDATSWGSANVLDDGTEKVDLRENGRYLLVRFDSSSVGDAWRLSGFDLYGTLSGWR